jgi:hypothetical protein
MRQVSVRTWAVLHHRLRLAEKTPQEAATAILLRGLMELCIYGAAPAPRGAGSDDGSDRDGEHLPVPWSCADKALLQVCARGSRYRTGCFHFHLQFSGLVGERVRVICDKMAYYAAAG